jgi:hypothetical protein
MSQGRGKKIEGPRQDNTVSEFFNHFAHELRRIREDLDELKLMVRALTAGEVIMAHTIDELVSAVEAQTTEVGNLEAFIQNQKALLVAQGLDGSKVDAAFAGVESNTGRIVTAMQTNVA